MVIMLKITATPTGAGSTLVKLEGKLLEPWVGELAAACEPFSDCPEFLRLDLAAVSFVDRIGFRFLLDWVRRGAAVESCSGLVAEMLRREKP
jgi:ABC-type transporter Mla MlaB component